jgi:hypothetical protein
MSETQTTRGYIETRDGPRERLDCQFNPKQLSISTSSTWTREPAKGAKDASEPEYVGANPWSLKMELFFDGWDAPSSPGAPSPRDVSTDIQKLLAWCKPTEESRKKEVPRPPVLVFHWGTTPKFQAYLSTVDATFTMFTPEGMPVRATANITLEQIPEKDRRGNPTSGGIVGRSSHLVADGDSLHSIAFQQLGDPRYWRALAAVNGIDDPLRLRPGTRLLLPDLAEAAQLS